MRSRARISDVRRRCTGHVDCRAVLHASRTAVLVRHITCTKNERTRASDLTTEEAELMRVWKAVACAAALTAFLAPGIRADEFNKKTSLTFSGPVQIPGATLAAGTYVFKLADLQGNRHVVQVFDKEGTKLYTTILAIPDERL